MRIAMMTNNYKPAIGGVQISVERLAEALRKRGHKVTIFAPSYENMVEEENVVRIAARKKAFAGGTVLPDLHDPIIDEVFREKNFDLIHVHHPIYTGYAGLRLSKKYHIPITFTYHTRYEEYLHLFKPYAMLHDKIGGEEDDAFAVLCKGIRGIVKAHNKMFINQCDLIFAPTPLIKDALFEMGSKTDVRVMPTGLAKEDFLYDEAFTKQIREQYLGDKKELYTSVARLSKEKNLPFLIRSMATYKERVGDIFRLLIIGDGAEKENLIAYTKELGLEDNIVFLGNIPHEQISNYNRAADMFLFSSRSETQGIVLLEAMAAKLPVLAVNASGVCDIVVDDYNGYKTGESEDEFAFKLERIRANKPGFEQMKEAAFETASQCTITKMAQAAEESYLYVLARRRQAVAEKRRARKTHIKEGAFFQTT